MPTDTSKGSHPKGRPWLARVKVRGVSYHLGYFATSDEAEWHEQDFRITMIGKPLNAPHWDPNAVQPWQVANA